MECKSLWHTEKVQASDRLSCQYQWHSAGTSGVNNKIHKRGGMGGARGAAAGPCQGARRGRFADYDVGTHGPGMVGGFTRRWHDIVLIVFGCQCAPLHFLTMIASARARLRSKFLRLWRHSITFFPQRVAQSIARGSSAPLHAATMSRTRHTRSFLPPPRMLNTRGVRE